MDFDDDDASIGSSFSTGDFPNDADDGGFPSSTFSELFPDIFFFDEAENFLAIRLPYQFSKQVCQMLLLHTLHISKKNLDQNSLRENIFIFFF